ncbi:MAG: aldo/keto reductase [Candidatus Omnitrophica bacterium]|nr:aldo/keto reductase [Candidatus Omnitrophota bacterium]
MPKMLMAKEGPEFSRIVQGFWRLADWNKTKQETIEFIHGCLELGITTFDHADIYGEYRCENLFGEAWADALIDRQSVQIVTKCGIQLITPEHPNKSYNTSEKHILLSVDNSLRNLRTDYIDLLLIHRPDPLMNAREVASAFSKLRGSGKVKHFGVSNFLPCQFELMASAMDFPLITNQIEYSVLNMEAQADGSVDLCQKRGIAPMAWSPFGGGRLFTDHTEQIDRLTKTLRRIGEEMGGASIDQVALAWILKHPVHFVPVLGSGKIERVQSAVRSLELSMTRDQWFSIWEASNGRDIP